MFGFQYLLISPHDVPTEQIPLMDSVYRLWTDSFGPLAAAGGERLDPDDFYRVDTMGILMHQNNIVGAHFYDLFDLRMAATKDHHFFQYLQSSTMENLVKRNHPKILTLEYTHIHRDYRKGQQNIPWAEVLSAVGLHYLDHSIADGMIGTPRIDAKVDQIAYRLDAEQLQEPVTKMKCPCAVIYFPKLEKRVIKNPEVQSMSDKLWDSRVDVTASAKLNLKKSA